MLQYSIQDNFQLAKKVIPHVLKIKAQFDHHL